MPETSAARAADGGRRASPATRDLTPVAPARPPPPTPQDPERGRERKGNESGDPGRLQPPRPGGVHVSLTTAPGRSPSSETGEGKERRDPLRRAPAAGDTSGAQWPRARLPGSCPAADRTYRVSPLQVTLLVAKGRDVDLHGRASPRRRASGGTGSQPRSPLRPRPAAPPPCPAPQGCVAAARVRLCAGRGAGAEGAGAEGAGLPALGLQA